ncbi:hypothetical protein ACFXJ6_29320 [Streptomyces sp. NPDC059218]|uniref:hypothetical protein n=1 Tax=unclassified Streptomyces TaxID=2593676 RepID=UPI003694B2C4
MQAPWPDLLSLPPVSPLRWKAVEYTRDWSRRQSHPHLCEHCQTRTVTAKQQAEARAEEQARQEREQERLRQEAEEQAAAQKAGGWLSRFRA